MIVLIFWMKNNWADNLGIFRKAFIYLVQIRPLHCFDFKLHGKLHLCQKTPVSSAKFRLENSIHCFNAKISFDQKGQIILPTAGGVLADF